MKAAWRRPVIDYLLSWMSVILAVAVFVLVLTLGARPASAQTSPQTSPQTAPQTIVATGGAACHSLPERAPDARLVLLAMLTEGADVTPPLVAFREALASYFGAEVDLVAQGAYAAGRLEGADGLVVFSNGPIVAQGGVELALREAVAADLPHAWVGPGAGPFAPILGLELHPPAGGAAAEDVVELFYKGVGIPVAGRPFAARVPAAPDPSDRILATGWRSDGTSFPAIIAGNRRAYVGFRPFAGLSSGLELPAVIDVLSGLFGRHARDPRILLRLEDLNGRTYMAGTDAVSRTADILRARDIPMHLAIIPQVVDEDQSLPDERVVADIRDAPDILSVVEAHPGAVVIVQHGFRHSRRDARNAGCDGPGCAFEFFLDDDETMGEAGAAAFARERLTAGRALLEGVFGPVSVFEAPHYTMSPGQSAVAEEMYPVLMHSLFLHGDSGRTSYLMPWLTWRGSTIYAPSSIGYVAYDQPESVSIMLGRLQALSRILPDPMVVIYFHPFITNMPERSGDLVALTDGARALGYRFANVCEEIAAR